MDTIKGDYIIHMSHILLQVQLNEYGQSLIVTLTGSVKIKISGLSTGITKGAVF